MSLADILAKRKAALAAGAEAVKTEAPVAEAKPALFSPELAPIKASILPEAVVAATVEAPVKESPPVATAPRVMTFAEKMAEKKALAEKNSPAVVVKPPSVMANMQKGLAEAIAKSQANPEDDAEDFARDEFKQAPENVQEGYKDIKGLVYGLAGTDDDDLAPAMSKLKKALLANPAACLLMLDQDIGKMTIALRRLTQEALVDATKEKKAKAPGAPKKAKTTMQVALTEEQMAAVFAEL